MNQWIAIRTGTPKEEKRYLVVTECGLIKVAEWVKPPIGKMVPHTWENVSGWMELPPLPKNFANEVRKGRVRDIAQKIERLTKQITELETQLGTLDEE